jgi:DNA-binding transcriptional ArsR family regulator
VAGRSSSRRRAVDALGSRPNERGCLVPRTCTICSHPARETIDSSLVRRVPYRNISKRFDVSEPALSRHLNDHLAEYVQQALRECGTSKGIKVLNKLGNIVERLEAFLDKAEDAEDGLGFRATAAELRKQLELISKLQGELAQEGATTVNVALVEHPDYQRLEELIFRALEKHRQARWDVAEALKELE